MRNPFTDIFKGKVVVVGIGNILRGDDGFGPAFVDGLKEEAELTVIDAGTAPENYVGLIVRHRPDVVVIADAVHLGLEPGEYRLMEASEILAAGFTTHDLSPTLFLEYLRDESGARIYFLGVQPVQVAFGEKMCSRVEETLNTLVGTVQEASACMRRT